MSSEIMHAAPQALQGN